ncbi:MAG: tetratricopeptide repeat protein [Verrucomicrobia bacterium]|nr:tetratricopeptide repeat protein [Verrucomicrobiota bacterium]
MARKSPRQSSPSPAPASPAGYVACTLAGVVVGALGMYWLLREDPALRGGPLASPGSGHPSQAGQSEMPSFAGMPPAQQAVQRGNWYYDHQRWTEAIAAYEEAIKLGADNPDVRTDLGSSYRFANQPMRALELYQFAQRQDPQHENSLLNTATLYSQVLRDPIKARETFEQFRRRFPNSASLGQVQRALEALRAEAGETPSTPAASAAATPPPAPGGTTALLPGPTPAPVQPAPSSAVPGGADLRSWMKQKESGSGGSGGSGSKPDR